MSYKSKDKIRNKNDEITKERINIYHSANLTSEFLPNQYYKANASAISVKSKLRKMNNLLKSQESEFIFTNPLDYNYKEKKFNYNFNRLVKVDNDLILTLVKDDNYQEIFLLLKSYLRTLFNDNEKSSNNILNLFYH